MHLALVFWTGLTLTTAVFASADPEAKSVGFRCKKGQVNPKLALVVGALEKSEGFERKLEKDGQVFFLSAKPVWTGQDVESIHSSPSSTMIQIRFSSTAAKEVQDATGKNLGKQAVLLLGNQILKAAVIKQKISGASIVMDTVDMGDSILDRICLAKK